jgi:GT2 family glycosyltransferase
MIQQWATGQTSWRTFSGVSNTAERFIQILEVDGDSIASGQNLTDCVGNLVGESWKNQLILIKCSKNLGYAGGMNIGIRFARSCAGSGSCLLLNNDVVLHEDFLSRIEVFAKQNPSSAIVQGKIFFYYDRTKLNSAGNEMDRLGRTRCRGLGEIDLSQYDQLITRGFFYASGAAMFIKGEFLSALNDSEYFDSELFAYHEDVDICWLARLLGFEVGVCPEAVCYHKGGNSLRGDMSLRAQYYGQRNNIRVLVKNYGLGQLAMVLPIAIVSDFLLAGLSAVYYSDLNYLRVLAESITWNMRHLDDTLRSRRRVQSLRQRTDHELISFMRPGSIALMEVVSKLPIIRKS